MVAPDRPLVRPKGDSAKYVLAHSKIHARGHVRLAHLLHIVSMLANADNLSPKAARQTNDKLQSAQEGNRLPPFAQKRLTGS